MARFFLHQKQQIFHTKIKKKNFPSKSVQRHFFTQQKKEKTSGDTHVSRRSLQTLAFFLAGSALSRPARGPQRAATDRPAWTRPGSPKRKNGKPRARPET